MPDAASIHRVIEDRRHVVPRVFTSPLIALLVALSILIWPVYLFPQGYPQPVSLALVLAFLSVLVKDAAAAMRLLRTPEIGLIALFVVYSLLVNLVFAAVYQDPRPLLALASAYYTQVLFGCIAFMYVLRTEPSAPRLVTLAILGALAVELVTLAVMVPAQGVRATLLFSNPNQLGFFGLLALAFILLLHRYTGYRTWVVAAGGTVALLLVLVSLSKGGILAAFALLYLHVLLAPLRDRRWRRMRPALLVLFPAALLGIAIAFADKIEVLSEVGDRLAMIGGQTDDSIAGRGYIRIFLWPQYLVFGAGEGLLGRWEYPREIHSMLGTLVFNYGLPGLGIVCALMAIAWRRNPRDFTTYFVPALLYSLVHQPMRQTMFWTLLIAIAHFGPVAGLRAPKQS
jgi:hypothetical protein